MDINDDVPISRDTRDTKNPRDTRDTRDPRDPGIPGTPGILGPRDIRGDLLISRDTKDTRDPRKQETIIPSKNMSRKNATPRSGAPEQLNGMDQETPLAKPNWVLLRPRASLLPSPQRHYTRKINKIISQFSN